MIKPKLLVAALAGLLFFTKAQAQTDTSYYDLGRIHLKKDFTQSVTVKGEDLAKMPFDNIADAINVWFNGSYSNNAVLVYVIDGNLVNDVNAYSIYDIDEVTLIQNALTRIAGATQQQQLVLIKTKRPKVKGSGVNVSGQAYVSSLYTNNIKNPAATPEQIFDYQTGLKSTNTVFQQYYVSAYQNTGTIQFGGSADYLGDGLPQIKEPSTNTTDNLDRIKLNAYFDAKLGRSLLDVTAGYTPQKITEKYVYNDYSTNNSYYLNDATKDHVFNATAKLVTNIALGLTNNIHVDYNNYVNSVIGAEANNDATDNYSNTMANTSGGYSHTIVAYDNLAYTKSFGNWKFEPSIDLSYRKFRDSTYNTTLLAQNNSAETSTSQSSTTQYAHMFLATPSINLSYKSYFNIEGGVLYNLSATDKVDNTHKLFPFVSTSADITRLINPASGVSVKVYGSYAVNAEVPDNFNSLPDFNNSQVNLPQVISQNVVIIEPEVITVRLILLTMVYFKVPAQKRIILLQQV